LLLTLHETTSNTARVLVANFVDLNSVVTAVERDDEISRFVIRLSADEFRIESEYVHVLLEHLFHVSLWRFGSERVNRAKGVLWGSIAVISGNFRLSDDRGWHGKLDWVLSDAHVSLIPLLGEVITIIDEAFSIVDSDFGAASKIGRPIELLSLKAHTGAVGKNWGLSKLLFLEEHREWSTSRILSIDLFDLNLTIREIIVEDVELLSTIVRAVVPEDVE